MNNIFKKIIIGSILTSMVFSWANFAASSVKGNVDTNPATVTGKNFWRLNGDVEDAYMKEVWFAFAKTDNNLSCSSSVQREKMDGGGRRGGDEFYANISFLDDNSTYYFKACAIDRDGDLIEGRTLELKTGNGGEEKAILDVKTFRDLEHSSNFVKLKGRVSGADNVQVWFAFSGDRKTPRCESSAQRQAVYGIFDDREYFYKRINFLEDSHRYEFRACAKNLAGDIFSGKVKYFSTERRDYSSIAETVTADATKIRYNSAQLNGKVFVKGTEDAKVYFLYGNSKNNLSLKTSTLDTRNSDMYFQSFVKLQSSTRYYFQAIVEDQNNDIVFKGSVKSFKTLATYNKEDTMVSTSSENSNYNLNEGIKENTIIKYVGLNSFKDLIYEKTVSKSENKDYASRVNVGVGDNVYYKLRFVNNSNEKIKNFTFTDVIPEGLEIVWVDENLSYNHQTRGVTWNVDKLNPKDSFIVVLQMKVLGGTDARTIISSTKVESNGKIAKTNSVRVIIDERKSGIITIDNGQAASAFNSNGPFPNTLLGWLIIIALILLVAFIISKLLEMEVHSKKEVEELEEAEDNRMN